jgi:hypothetical protein
MDRGQVLTVARVTSVALDPLVWTALTVVRGAIDRWYPYPFLNPADGGYGVVAATVVAIIAAFLVFSAMTIAIGNARGRATREPRPAT